MAESKSAALPLGYAPTGTGEPHIRHFACGGGTIAAPPAPINVHCPVYMQRKRALTGLGYGRQARHAMQGRMRHHPARLDRSVPWPSARRPGTHAVLLRQIRSPREDGRAHSRLARGRLRIKERTAAAFDLARRACTPFSAMIPQVIKPALARDRANNASLYLCVRVNTLLTISTIYFMMF